MYIFRSLHYTQNYFYSINNNKILLIINFCIYLFFISLLTCIYLLAGGRWRFGRRWFTASPTSTSTSTFSFSILSPRPARMWILVIIIIDILFVWIRSPFVCFVLFCSYYILQIYQGVYSWRSWSNAAKLWHSDGMWSRYSATRCDLDRCWLSAAVVWKSLKEKKETECNCTCCFLYFEQSNYNNHKKNNKRECNVHLVIFFLICLLCTQYHWEGECHLNPLILFRSMHSQASPTLRICVRKLSDLCKRGSFKNNIHSSALNSRCLENWPLTVTKRGQAKTFTDLHSDMWVWYVASRFEKHMLHKLLLLFIYLCFGESAGKVLLVCKHQKLRTSQLLLLL